MGFIRASSAETDAERIAADLAEQLPTDASALWALASSLSERLPPALASRLPLSVLGASHRFEHSHVDAGDDARVVRIGGLEFASHGEQWNRMQVNEALLALAVPPAP